MKLVSWDTIIDNGFSQKYEFEIVETHIKTGINLITWPPGSDKFTIFPVKEANGVKPIKEAFVAHLRHSGWVPEYRRFDAHYAFPGSTIAPFAVEWETGNISSSHRSINRMALGMLEGRLSGGVLIVPSRPGLYNYLTDRVGNSQELKPYYPLWQLWSQHQEFSYLAIITVEHDAESMNVPHINKGTDGRALL
jgi:Restriction endonuclease BamHI